MAPSDAQPAVASGAQPAASASTHAAIRAFFWLISSLWAAAFYVIEPRE